MNSEIRIPNDLVRQLRNYSINPVDVVLYINSECNLRCKHCYVGNQLLNESVTLNSASVSNFLDECPPLSRLTILGGEPLLHPNFNYITASLKKDRIFETRVTTNLTSLEHIDIASIKRSNIRMCVSVDGHSQELHDSIRGKGSFSRTLKNIQFLVEENIDVEITHTITTGNDGHLRDMLIFCRSLGVRRLNLHRNTRRGNTLLHPELELTPTLWVHLTEWLKSHSESRSDDTIQVRYEVGFVTTDVFQHLVASRNYHHHADASFYSAAGGQRIVIYPDGKLYISSEAFGTDSFIGTFSKGIFEFNGSPRNELLLAKQKNFTVTDLNPRVVGDSNFPIALSVSYRKTAHVNPYSDSLRP